jgi:diguanylate cyclase (GGDEF)-like protein
MHSITIDVEVEQENLGGLLEMGYFSSIPLGIDEKSIIKSILSVMVMVISSSRTLKKTLSELDYHAKQDPLTGLFNRRFFNEFLEKEIERSKRHNHEFSILMLDLDRFKGINDSYGHLFGDTVLRDIALILKNKIRRGDIIARLGGDEFIIILPETSATGAHYVAEEIKTAIETHQFSDEHDFHITTSIGLICYPTHSTSMAKLLSNVDIALYQAKEDGRNIIRGYDSNIKAEKNSGRLFKLTQDLTRAIKDKRIIAYFQPIVTTAEQSVYAFEVLARLVNKDGKIISAGEFIGAAEQIGISTDFDKYMIQNVTNTLLTTFENPEDYPLIFINLSPVSVQKRGILEYASSVCKEKGIPPERIVFEITEREAVNDMSNMKQFLGELRNQGFSFALDDFGSGYNSFHYLRELYFEYVKIDGEFVRNMLHNKADNALIESLFSLCEKLDMKTIAEFVESDEILTRLQEIGITYCQGFHTGIPSPTIAPIKSTF